MRKLVTLIALFVCCALFFVACGKSDTASNTNTNTAGTENGNKASTTSDPPKSSTPASTTSVSSGDKVGVAECDDYLAKYDACVSGKIPESSRAQYKSSIEDMRKQWRELAANPQTKAGLAMACKIASDQSKEQFKTYGCDF